MTFDITTYRFYQKLIQLPFVEKIILFGSRANGTFRPKSDIDIAIFCPSADTYQWNEVLNIIEDADTLLSIDCVNLNDLPSNSALKNNIEENGIVIYEKIKS
jgi:predicted nucleotidyltransferase